MARGTTRRAWASAPSSADRSWSAALLEERHARPRGDRSLNSAVAFSEHRLLRWLCHSNRAAVSCKPSAPCQDTLNSHPLLQFLRLVAMTTPGWQLTHRLQVGHEVDYSPCSGGLFWLPARVEDTLDGGAVIKVRFSAGAADVTHTLDLRNGAHVARLSPAGERTGLRRAQLV